MGVLLVLVTVRWHSRVAEGALQGEVIGAWTVVNQREKLERRVLI